jgi:hypothetical protein
VASFTVTSPGNVFRGLAIYNDYYGIKFSGDAADRNRVIGSFIGTNAAGTYGDSSAFTLGAGLWLTSGASDNIIGTPTLADRDVISGNKTVGVKIEQHGSARNIIQNNIIGLNPSGTARLANNAGFDLQWYSSDNLIGGTRAGERNVISGNSYAGIDLSHTTVDNQVLGNYVGTTPSGTSATTWSANGDGLLLKDNANGNVIVGNVLSGNQRNGIWCKHNFTERNTIEGNRIGVGADGSRVGNGSWGIWFTGHDHLIVNNVIANNPSGGINVNNDLGGEANYPPGLTEHNRISGNSFFDNGGRMGIDITPTGPNPNDPGDGDAGVQALLNFPEIGTAVTGHIAGSACASCTVEIYVADTSGEGRQRLGSVTTDGAGAFAFDDPSVVTRGRYTALAIDTLGNTSEFSPAVSPDIAPVTPASISGSFSYQTVNGRSIAVTPDTGFINNNGASGTSSKVQFNFNVPASATYALRSEVTAPSGTSDSFYVQVDGQPSSGVIWDVAGGSALHTDLVNSRGAADPYLVTLSPGNHTVTLSLREDGTGVATMALVPPDQTPTGLTLVVPANQLGTVGTPVDVQASATDPDLGILSFSAIGLPPGVVLDPRTGHFAGTPTVAGFWFVNLLVTDGLEWRANSFSWAVSPTNSAPAVTNPGDQRDVIGVPTATTIAATDPDGDALTFTATGLPAGLSISPGGAISGTPTTVGTTRTEVTVADTAGHTTSMSFAWEITHPPFTCSVDRATRTLSWTDQGASSYQIRHTVDGVESYLKQVSGLSTPVSALYGTYRVTYSRNGIKFDTTCDGPALPPSLFACHIDVPTSTLSWTDQGALSYSIRRIVNGVETYLGSVSGLSTTITMPTATHSVTYNDSGTKVTTICSP